MENQNGLSINVLGYDDGSSETGVPDASKACYYPIRISDKKVPDDKVVNVLLIGNEYTQHYVLITSMSGLLSKNSKNTAAKHYCYHCLRG